MLWGRKKKIAKSVNVGLEGSATPANVFMDLIDRFIFFVFQFEFKGAEFNYCYFLSWFRHKPLTAEDVRIKLKHLYPILS